MLDIGYWILDTGCWILVASFCCKLFICKSIIFFVMTASLKLLFAKQTSAMQLAPCWYCAACGMRPAASRLVNINHTSLAKSIAQ